jgi:hypothetical protein
LAFSAALRLKGVSPAARAALVEGMIADLGLTACADVMIGGEMIKGISGGQRKRTSVRVWGLRRGCDEGSNALIPPQRHPPHYHLFSFAAS